MGSNVSEPYNLHQSGIITAIAISPCKRYIAVGVESQLIIYEIRKASSVVLLKNFTDLKVNKIIRLGFCEEGPKLFFVD